MIGIPLRSQRFRHSLLSLLAVAVCQINSATAQVERAESNVDPSVNRLSTFYKCLLTAEQTADNRLAGTIQLLPPERLAEETDEASETQFTIGRTNLEQLSLNAGGNRIEVGADAAGNLIPLSEGFLKEVDGTWEKSGNTVGETTSYRLLLPSVAIAEIRFVTQVGATVSSPDALVVAGDAEGSRQSWTIYPSDPRNVTIRLTGVTMTDSARQRVLSLSGDVDLEEMALSAAWLVSSPDFSGPGPLQLRFTAGCDVIDVRLADNSPLPWSLDDSGEQLSIKLPAGIGAGTLKIEVAGKTQVSRRREIPIPVPLKTNSDSKAPSTDTETRLQSSSFRVSISSSLLLVSHELRGLYERDITWSSEGAQTLDLVQFDDNIHAVLVTTPALPVLDDASYILFNPESQAGRAVVYLEVSAQAGSAGRLEYRVPATWQVTEIVDLASGQPLLFRMLRDEGQRADRRFETWLRSPLLPNTSQRLRIQLRSTEANSVSRFLPGLAGVPSRRVSLFAATDSTDLTAFGLTKADPTLVVPDWLPQNTFRNARYFQTPVGGMLETATDATVRGPASADRVAQPAPAIETSSDSEKQNVTGTVFEILGRDADGGKRIEGLARLHVNTGDVLRFEIPDATDVQAFVNGRRCFPGTLGSSLELPLPSVETDSTAIVDVYFTVPTVREDRDGLKVPLIQLLLDGSSNLTTIVVGQTEELLTALNDPAGVRQIDVGSVRQFPNKLFTENVTEQLSELLQPFLSRWRTSQSESAVLIDDVPNRDVRLQYGKPDFQLSVLFLWLVVCFAFWMTVIHKQWLSPLVQSGSLIALSVATFASSPPLTTFLQTLTGALILAILWNVSRCVVSRVLSMRYRGVSRRQAIVTAVTGIFLASMSAIRGADTVPEGVLVISCEIDVTLESKQSALAVVQCKLARSSGFEGRLKIPVGGVSLIECRVDDSPVLPRRVTDEELELVIRGEDENVGAEEEADDEKNDENADEKDDEESPTERKNWSRHSLNYTVRAVPQWSGQSCRVTVPVPMSPAFRVDVLDQTGAIRQATLRGASEVSSSGKDGSWQFSSSSGGAVVELDLAGAETMETVDNSKVVTVVCDAEVSPPELKLTATYVFKNARVVDEFVRIGTEAGQRIKSVEDSEGNALVWSVQDNFALVRLPAGNDDFTVVVRRTADLPLSLLQTISTKQLLTVNGRSVKDATLRLRTSPRFFVEAVASGGQALTRIDVTENGASEFRLPVNSSAIAVTLQEFRSSREASILQSAVVDVDRIRWACDCRFNISVQPIYRQRIQLSDFVDITGIRAERDGVSLIRAWTRSDREIVIAFREATRGDISIKLTGEVLRSSESDSQLPAISLPDAEVLEPSLEISAASGVVAMISDLGSSVPDVDIDLQAERIPQEPVRMTLLDEQTPPSVQRMQRRRISLNAALVVYNVGERPYIAEVLTLSPADSRYETKFRLRPDLFAGVQPSVFRDGKALRIVQEAGEYIIPAATSESDVSTTIVIPHFVASGQAGGQSIHLPEFFTEVNVQSRQGYDCRVASSASPTANGLPNWVREGLALAEILEEPSGVVINGVDFDSEVNAFRIRVRTQNPATEERENRNVAAFGTHIVELSRNSSVSRSDFLLFSGGTYPATSLLLPEGLQILDLRVNGKAQTVRVEGAYCEVSAPDKINHVSLTWVDGLEPTTALLRLPVVANTVSDNVAFINVGTVGERSGWQVRNPKLTEAEFDSLRSAAFRRSLRLVSPAAPAVLAEDFQLSADSSFWQQVELDSSNAAQSYRSYLTTLREAQNASTVIANAEDRVIGFSEIYHPSLLEFAGVFLGSIMIVAVFVRDIRQRSATAHRGDTEVESASTVIHEPMDSVERTTGSSQQLPDDRGETDESAVSGEDV